MSGNVTRRCCVWWLHDVVVWWLIIFFVCSTDDVFRWQLLRTYVVDVGKPWRRRHIISCHEHTLWSRHSNMSYNSMATIRSSCCGSTSTYYTTVWSRKSIKIIFVCLKAKVDLFRFMHNNAQAWPSLIKGSFYEAYQDPDRGWLLFTFSRHAPYLYTYRYRPEQIKSLLPYVAY